LESYKYSVSNINAYWEHRSGWYGAIEVISITT